MSKPKIKVGSYYEFKLSNDRKIAFAVLYGFESVVSKNGKLVLKFWCNRVKINKQYSLADSRNYLSLTLISI